MSGLFKRLSGRRSAGPEGSEPPTAAEHGTADAPATPPAEPGGHQSLLTDPAAPTRVLREGEQPPATRPERAHALRRAGAGHEPAPPVHGPAARAVHGPGPPPVYGPHGAAARLRPGAGPGRSGARSPRRSRPPVRIEPVADLPAGLDPDELAAAPGTSARRGKLRRRIAFLRAARELLLRDLGGFIYELHRTAHDIEHEAHRRLRETKLARLSRVDAELHELEYRLDDVRRQVLVREPGVGGECSHCGELYASSAHYCSNCGNPLTESARRELAKAQAPVAEPTPAPVRRGRAAGARSTSRRRRSARSTRPPERGARLQVAESRGRRRPAQAHVRRGSDAGRRRGGDGRRRDRRATRRRDRRRGRRRPRRRRRDRRGRDAAT